MKGTTLVRLEHSVQRRGEEGREEGDGETGTAEGTWQRLQRMQGEGGKRLSPLLGP